MAKAGDGVATKRSQYFKSPFLKSVIAFALEEVFILCSLFYF